MKSHGTLFSAPMVQALLAGTKTQTRRAVAPYNSMLDGYGVGKTLLPIWNRLDWSSAYVDQGPSPAGNTGPYWKVRLPALNDREDDTWHRVYPRVQAGDSIWVKETHSAHGAFGTAGRVCYRADIADGDEPHGLVWTPSILMPRAASRLTLDVKAIRTERLKSISEADALAEGCATDEGSAYHVAGYKCVYAHRTAVGCYMTLWGLINGAGSWDKNPPVWIYDFKPRKNKETA